jgi:hypothetical protein
LRLSDGCTGEETPDVSDSIGLAEALFGLPRFRFSRWSRLTARW